MRLWQLFFVAIISVGGAFPAVVLAESKITRIGVMLPLSGETMRSGRELQRGLELVARERDSLRYFVFEDIGDSDPAKLNAAAERLLQLQVDIVLLARTDDALAVYPFFAQKQVPLLVLLDSNDQVQTESPFVYSGGYSTEYAARLIAEYARDTREARRVIVISDITRSSQTAAMAFEEVIKVAPGALVTREEYAAVLDSGASFTAKLSDNAVEAVYAPLTASKVKQIAALLPSGDTSPVLLTGDYVDRDALAHPAFDNVGLFVTLPWVDGEGALGASYLETYESEPVDLSVVALAHEAGGMLLTAVQEAESQHVPLIDRLDPLWPTNRTTRKPTRLYEAHGTIIQQVVVEPPIDSSVQESTTPPQAESTPEQAVAAGSGEETPQSAPNELLQDPASHLKQQQSPESDSASQNSGGETPLVVEEPVVVPSVAPAAVENDVAVQSSQTEEAAAVTPEADLESYPTQVSEPALSDPSSAESEGTGSEETSSHQDITPVAADPNSTSSSQGEEVPTSGGDIVGDESASNPPTVAADTTAPEVVDSVQSSEPAPSNDPSSAGSETTGFEETSLQHDTTPAVADVTADPNPTPIGQGDEVLTIDGSTSSGGVPVNPTDVESDTAAPQVVESVQNDGVASSATTSDETTSGDSTENNLFDNLADQGF